MAAAFFLAGAFDFAATVFFFEGGDLVFAVVVETDFFFVDFLVERTTGDLLTFLASVRFAFLSTAIFKVLGRSAGGSTHLNAAEPLTVV